jgi:D-alanyl-D-alanine carboxypeptidase/D-alanyl-D-alanine-endopeptidase (penicillin-binding protein 4)
MFAETILRYLAAYTLKTKAIPHIAGIDVIKNWLNNNAIDTKHIVLLDGSGLSRQNFISTDFMCSYLLKLYSMYASFEQIIPAPGEKGQLTNFMSNYPQKNRSRVHLKSGSMTGVLNYAGYVKNKKGDTLCVTVMTNNFACKVSKIRPKFEKLIFLISNLN